MSRPRKVMTRYGDALVANAIVTDEAGEVILNLWRSQINLVKPGCIIRIEIMHLLESIGIGYSLVLEAEENLLS